MAEEKKKDIDQLLAESQITLIISKSEANTLRFYLDKAIIDAEGDYAIGIGNKVSVEHLHSIRRKLNA